MADDIVQGDYLPPFDLTSFREFNKSTGVLSDAACDQFNEAVADWSPDELGTAAVEFFVAMFARDPSLAIGAARAIHDKLASTILFNSANCISSLLGR